MAQDSNSETIPTDVQLSEQAAAIQILLAEKRTSLAVMRTAIAIAAIPLSITTVLVALSRYFSWLDNLHFLIPMYAIMTFLIAFSLYLMIRSVSKISRYDKLIEEIRGKSSILRKLVS